MAANVWTHIGSEPMMHHVELFWIRTGCWPKSYSPTRIQLSGHRMKELQLTLSWVSGICWLSVVSFLPWHAAQDYLLKDHTLPLARSAQTHFCIVLLYSESTWQCEFLQGKVNVPRPPSELNPAVPSIWLHVALHWRQCLKEHTAK